MGKGGRAGGREEIEYFNFCQFSQSYDWSMSGKELGDMRP